MSWLSCKRYTERLSQSSDVPLGIWDNMALKFHAVICFTCRRFARQLRLLSRAINACRDEDGVIADFGASDTEAPKLSPAAAERIKASLAKHEKH